MVTIITGRVMLHCTKGPKADGDGSFIFRLSSNVLALPISPPPIRNSLLSKKLPKLLSGGQKGRSSPKALLLLVGGGGMRSDDGTEENA